MINTVSANTRQFQRHIRTVSKSDESFSSALSKQSENNPDVSDMYIRTPQFSAEYAFNNFDYVVEMQKQWIHKGYMDIPVVGDLNELLDNIEKDLANGETLRGALQNWIDKCVKELCTSEKGALSVGGNQADLITINPDTGEVFNSNPKGRCIVIGNIQDMDYATVKSEADDLATYLRYTVFKKETDDPEKVEALLAEIRAKQSDYDTSRFLPIFSSYGKQGEKNVKYWRELLELDKINWDGLSEEERDKLSDKLFDELMRILGEHYSSDDNKDDGLHEEMKKMQFKNVGKAKITWRVLSEL